MFSQLNKIKIKQLKKHDATSSMAKKLWEVAEEGYQTGSPWSPDQFLATLQADSSVVLTATNPVINAAHISEKTVGLLIASDTGIEMDIYIIVVKEAYKKRGIGRQLFKALFSYAKKNHSEAIFLEVRITNEPAIQLYKQMNFKGVGIRKNYYSNPTEDALLMRVNI